MCYILHRKDLWLTFGECRTNGDTVQALAKRFWHRFLAGINTTTEQLKGIVEADEPFFLKTAKDVRVWTRAREGKASEKAGPKGPQARGIRCQSGARPLSGCRFWSRLIILARPSVPVLPAVNADTLR
ncbi:MAG: hypothetical protein GDA36_11360 [Rhodobacteraceae bacterium]|nr:hypothetical protein [Paracoccaceae bacterium]